MNSNQYFSTFSIVSFTSQHVKCGVGRIEEFKILENNKAQIKLANMDKTFRVSNLMQLDTVVNAVEANSRLALYARTNCNAQEIDYVKVVKDD